MKSAVHTISSIITGHIPGQLVVQFTSTCNATCPQCGMRRSNTGYSRRTLSKGEIFAAIQRASDLNFQAISFTGGEPFLFENLLLESIEKAKQCKIPLIRTGTNGLPFLGHDKEEFVEKMKRLADRLCTSGLRNLWISIDSSDPSVHESMRGLKGVIEGIRKALPIFHRAGIYPAANLGINRATGGKIENCPVLRKGQESDYFFYWKDAFRRFYTFVLDLGFTMTNACYPMGGEELALDPSYQAASSSPVVTFSRAEKSLIFRALFEVIPEFRNRLRIFTPRASLFTLAKKYNDEPCVDFPCRGGIDFFFISADDGLAYPCGYRSKESFGPFLSVKKQLASPFCTQCDWECFRDPGALLEPVLMMLRNPLKMIRDKVISKEFFNIWKDDALYYVKHSFFDGRKAY